MNQTGYWVFNESQLDAVLRDWALDHRHDDQTEIAAKERFNSVADFLYSRQARRAGLYKSQEQTTDERRQTA